MLKLTLLLLAISTLAGLAVQAQESERVFYFKAAETPQERSEIVTVIRMLAGIPSVTISESTAAAAMKGTKAQLDLAAWIFAELDWPATAATQEPRHYRIPDEADELVALVYVPGVSTIQDFHEIATVARSTAEIRLMFTYNKRWAIAMRGTTDQVSMVEWIVRQLTAPEPSNLQYHVAGRGDDVVQVLWAASTAPMQDFFEQATMIRSLAENRWLFTYGRPRAMVLRGKPDQNALAEWILAEVGRPPEQRDASASYQYRGDGSNNDIVRIFYLPRSLTAQNVQEEARSIVAQTRMRVAVLSAPRAVAVRGTLDQVTTAERLVTALRNKAVAK